MNGWPTEPLRKLVEVNYGDSLPDRIRASTGKVPVYGSNGIVGCHDRAVARAPAIVIGRKGSIGALNYANEPSWPIDTAYYIDEFPERLSPMWLFLFLSTLPLTHLKQDGPKAGIRREDLYELEIPVPPLAEQRRLVARIEALTSRLEQARQARQAALAEADSLVKASVTNLFPDSDSWKSVRDAVSPKKGAVRNGPFGSQLLHHEFTKSGVAAIGTRDVQTNRFELKSGWYISREKFEQFRRYQVFPGDVLCTIVGASIGRFCVVPEDVPLAFTTKHIQALTLNPETAVPGFVSLMLNFHPLCRKSMFLQVDGSAQPSLNATKVLETELPLPSVAEQRLIVARLDAVAAKQAELRRLQTETEAELAAFTPALLAKAFRGEL